MKWAAYAWLTGFVLLVSFLVIASTEASDQVDPTRMSFWSLFSFHLLILIFLAGWWLLAGRPDLAAFFNLQLDRAGESILIGLAVGVAGWFVTIGLALLAGMILTAAGWSPEDFSPSPMIPWMAGLAPWRKALIVLSAMTVEELFFRGWLQKRVGLIASTIVFAVAHAGYGQPFMLIGVTLISLVIGATFYYTRRLLPCIIAHGVFDAIQLFVVVPLALKFAPQMKSVALM
ncbi:MAG TPA: type II CAAX endopeptidase family protein [Thermoanaerobaculia bacterium]|nr:type II CAAX endopeptidase family protein [Thermoanaerobaculia bacterium]